MALSLSKCTYIAVFNEKITLKTSVKSENVLVTDIVKEGDTKIKMVQSLNIDICS